MRFYFRKKRLVPAASTDTPIVTSFAEQYPFETDLPSSKLSQFANEYINRIQKFTNSTETYLKSNRNPLCKPLSNLLARIRISTNDDVVMQKTGAFIKLSNGYLAGCFPYCPSVEIQNNILEFSSWLNERGISFLALVTPDKGDDSESDFPVDVPQGYHRMHLEYLAFLAENDISYLDAKSTLLASNADFYSWFYKSDHHWNVHAAFEVSQKTAEYLQDELHLKCDTTILTEDNFELVNYPDSFLGSYGVLLGDSWREDMEVLFPTINSSFRIEIPSLGICKTGVFEDTLLDKTQLGNTSSYPAYLYGDRPLIRIENNLCQNGTRVLVIKQSFGDIFNPYFANTVQYLDIIDPRHFDGSIRSFIEQTKPDIVITCMGVVYEQEESYLTFK